MYFRSEFLEIWKTI